MIFNKAQALISLCPTASFVMRNNDIEWNDTTQSCPTESELNVEIARLESEYNERLQRVLNTNVQKGDIVCHPFGHAHASAIHTHPSTVACVKSA